MDAPSLWHRLEARDERLVRSVDASFAAGALMAGTHLVCHLGCTACCVGVFDVTALDALRLQVGLAALADRDPEAAGAIARRAGSQWEDLVKAFPGEREQGVLTGKESERQAFFARFDESVCPLLDARTGGCTLYLHRPLSCRTFGLPVHCGGQDLPPCPLNFTTADSDAVETARIVPDPDDTEGDLLSEVEQRLPTVGDTVVAAAIALADRW